MYGSKIEDIEIPDSVAEDLKNAEIEPGGTQTLMIGWTPDRDLKNTSIKITSSEGQASAASAKSYSLSEEVPYTQCLEFEDYELSYDGETATVNVNLANHGNADAGALDVVFKNTGIISDDGREIAKTHVSGVKSGEEQALTFSFVPIAADFNNLGRVELELSAVSGETELANRIEEIALTKPLIAEIENGAEEISLKEGDTKQLTYRAVPFNEIAGTPEFDSSNSEVAYVDEDGILHALKAGTAVITIYYPDYSISDTVTVKVAAKAAESARNSDRYKRDSGGSTISAGRSTSGNAVQGQWSYNQQSGKWSFASGNRAYKSEWAYIYNPYATESQAKTDWFRFECGQYDYGLVR